MEVVAAVCVQCACSVLAVCLQQPCHYFRPRRIQRQPGGGQQRLDHRACVPPLPAGVAGGASQRRLLLRAPRAAPRRPRHGRGAHTSVRVPARGPTPGQRTRCRRHRTRCPCLVTYCRHVPTAAHHVSLFSTHESACRPTCRSFCHLEQYGACAQELCVWAATIFGAGSGLLSWVARGGGGARRGAGVGEGNEACVPI